MQIWRYFYQPRTEWFQWAINMPLYLSTRFSITAIIFWIIYHVKTNNKEANNYTGCHRLD